MREVLPLFLIALFYRLRCSSGFELNCTVDVNRTLVVRCEGINGVIKEVVCIYDDGPRREMCELPVTIDFIRYDRNPGYHNITIVANSTLGEMNYYTGVFFVQDIECVQLTEPGRVTVICQSRVMLDREIQPVCQFDGLPNIHFDCKNINNIVIVPSEISLLSEFTMELRFNVSVFDSMKKRIQTSLQIQLTQEQLVECSTTLNCSSNGTLMSARECCVSSEDGLSYSIQGHEQCHTCIVFGWFENSFIGLEQEIAHSLSAGYLKGAEQAGEGATMILNVMRIFRNANVSDFSLETTRIEVRPQDDLQPIVFTFVADRVFQEPRESLTLQLIPTPSSLQTMPIGEAVFFKNEIGLTVMNAKSPKPGPVNAGLIGGVVGGVLSVLIAGIVVLIISCLCYWYFHAAKTTAIEINLGQLLEEEGEEQSEISVKSAFKLDIPPYLITPSSSIKLLETIGQGEFGIVYKGYILKANTRSIDEYLAIKTLKGFYDHTMVRDMLKECSRMSEFNHVHVLTLKGVCLDGGPAPYIIMPFMANGSLLAYLRKNRKSLVISLENADNQDVEVVCKQLMDMCIQVAKGMQYLASMKVVHRDLAARNCMIDANLVIKVADFGLAESVRAKEYFRQDEESSVKLPLKWLAPESISDHIFSEKTDVWAYGVTCWEVFTGGKVPYSELTIREIPKLLAEGYRLEKPSNDACNDEMYDLMQHCWMFESAKRPIFTEMVESLSDSLESMAGYMHIGAFGIQSS